MGLKRIYLLDTNIISEGVKSVPSEKCMMKMEMYAGFSVIASPVWYELLKGINVLPEGKRKDSLKRYVFDYIQNMYSIVPYDSHCASIHADMYARMQKNGTSVGQLDMQIAAVAMANNLIVVTRNIKYFAPIQKEYSLMVENWFA